MKKISLGLAGILAFYSLVSMTRAEASEAVGASQDSGLLSLAMRSGTIDPRRVASNVSMVDAALKEIAPILDETGSYLQRRDRLRLKAQMYEIEDRVDEIHGRLDHGMGALTRASTSMLYPRITFWIDNINRRMKRAVQADDSHEAQLQLEVAKQSLGKALEDGGDIFREAVTLVREKNPKLADSLVINHDLGLERAVQALRTGEITEAEFTALASRYGRDLKAIRDLARESRRARSDQDWTLVRLVTLAISLESLIDSESIGTQHAKAREFLPGVEALLKKTRRLAQAVYDSK